MSTVNPVEVIAEALAEHSAVGFGKCRCGWSTETELGRSWREAHEAHQASAIAALPNIAIVPVMRGDWAPGRWWRVIAPDGSLWCETSVEQEARNATRNGDVLERLWDGPHLREWRAAGGES